MVTEKKSLSIGSIAQWIIVAIIPLCINSCQKRKAVNNESEVVHNEMKVASFNIRFDNPGDGANNWHQRKAAIVAFLRSEDMHLIGMQEVLHNQLGYLKTNLPGYITIGVGREDGKNKGEYSPIFYQKETFSLLDSGTFWLSTTPDQPSVGWDAAMERICTFAVLKDQRNDREVHFYNTHFDHIGKEARDRSAQLIMDSIASKSAGQWIVFTGDLNTEPNKTPYQQVIEAGLQDAYESDIKLGPVGTYNGFNIDQAYQRRIDYVFVDGFTPVLYVSNNLIFNGNFLSDHFPVIALLEYRPL